MRAAGVQAALHGHADLNSPRFGVRYLSTLGGIAFLFHQVGSFLGVLIGGYLFDTTGSYNLMWILTIAMGLAAALINWPIDERQIVRTVPTPA